MVGPDAMNLRATIASIITLLVSCGGSVTSDPASELQEASFVDAYAHAACDNLAPCCQSAGYDRAKDGCFESVQEEVRGWVGAARAAAAAYDPVAGTMCVETARAVTDQCLTFKDPIANPGVCYRVFTGGNKALGEACDLWDCEGPAACLWTGGVESVCTAYRIGQEGESCARPDGIWVMCGSGLECMDGICSRPHALAEPCSDGFRGDLCEVGATCDWNETKTCVPARAVGESCTDQTQCEAYSCVDGICVRTAIVADMCTK